MISDLFSCNESKTQLRFQYELILNFVKLLVTILYLKRGNFFTEFRTKKDTIIKAKYIVSFISLFHIKTSNFSFAILQLKNKLFTDKILFVILSQARFFLYSIVMRRMVVRYIALFNRTLSTCYDS